MKIVNFIVVTFLFSLYLASLSPCHIQPSFHPHSRSVRYAVWCWPRPVPGYRRTSSAVSIRLTVISLNVRCFSCFSNTVTSTITGDIWKSAAVKVSHKELMITILQRDQHVLLCLRLLVALVTTYAWLYNSSICFLLQILLTSVLPSAFYKYFTSMW